MCQVLECRYLRSEALGLPEAGIACVSEPSDDTRPQSGFSEKEMHTFHHWALFSTPTMILFLNAFHFLLSMTDSFAEYLCWLVFFPPN